MKSRSLLLLCVLFVSTSSYAETYTVTNTDASGAGSFAQAYTNATLAGDIIAFNVNATEISLTDAFAMKSITIDGLNAFNSKKMILKQATDSKSFFTLASGITGTFKNLIFVRTTILGNTAIISVNGSTLNIDACEFKNINAQSNNGGATRIQGVANITNCLFQDNIASGGYGGGAICIYNSANVTIENSSFIGNTALAGGAIMANGTVATGYTLNVSNCTFANNAAELTGTDKRGGAVYLQGPTATESNATFTNCTFTGNSAGNNSGGLCAFASAGKKININVINSIFAHNMSAGNKYSDIDVWNLNDRVYFNTATNCIYGSLLGTATGINWTSSINPVDLATANIFYKKEAWNSTLERPLISSTNNQKIVLLSASSINDNRGAVVNDCYYQSNATGSWDDLATWQTLTWNSVSKSSGWISSAQKPDLEAGVVYIQKSKNVTVDSDATSPSLIVLPGANLTVLENKKLDISGDITLESSTIGTGTVVDNGTLTVSGKTYVNQHLTSGRNWYVSAPLTGSTTKALNAATNTAYWYNETIATNNWIPITDNSTGMDIMKGYVATVSSDANILFTGTNNALNTGAKEIDLFYTLENSKRGFNLIGNPYPSYLDWTLVSAANSTKMLTSTMWYRTHTASTYAFWTVNGSLGLGSPTTASKDIPPMQAFWVRTIEGGATLTVNNTMRNDGGGTSNILKVPAKNENQILRLTLSDGKTEDETVIYFNINASNGLDSFDSPKWREANVSGIHTSLADEILVINGMNNVVENETIPLGFAPASANTFSIKANEISNFEVGTQVFIYDDVTKATAELTDGRAYTFTSDATPTSSRFVISFKSPSITTRTSGNANNDINITYLDAKIVVNNANANGKLLVHNAIGQQLLSKSLTSPNSTVNINLKSGIYIISFQSNGKQTTQKVVIQ